MYLEDWTGGQARIFCAGSLRRQRGGEGAGGVGSIGGQADDQRNHFSPSRLRKNYVGPRDRRPSETGQTRWDPICPRRAFLALHASRSMDAGGLFQHPATLNPAFCVLTTGYT